MINHECKSQENTQKTRKILVEQMCKAIPKRDITVDEHQKMSEILVDDEKKLIFCTVRKVASSNWKALMYYSSSKYKQQYPCMDQRIENIHSIPTAEAYGLRRLRDYGTEEMLYRLKHYYKVMFVRHPLRRLVSTYQSKFQTPTESDMEFHKRYVMETARYRTNVSEEDANKVRFSDIVNYLLDNRRFSALYNVHWRTYQDLCLPCHIKYDFIGTLETLDTDARCIVPRITQDMIDFPAPGFYGPTSIGQSGSENQGKEFMNFLHHDLSGAELAELKKIYIKDCQMFAYPCMDL